MQHTHRAPLRCENKLRATVAIEVGEYRRRNESDPRERRHIGAVQHEVAIDRTEEEPGFGRQRPSAGNDASTDEEIEHAVAVHIGHRQRAHAGGVARKEWYRRHRARCGAVAHDRRDAHGLAGRRRLIVGLSHHQRLASAPIGRRQCGGEIERLRAAGDTGAHKATAGVAQYGQCSPASGGEHQIVATIAVHVDPAHARPQLTEPGGQQWLATKIGEERIHVHRAPEQRRRVGEERGLWRARRVGGQCGHGGRFMYFVEAVCARDRNSAPCTAPPPHLDDTRSVQACGKRELRIAARQVVATRRHLAGLHGKRLCAQGHHRADAARIGRYAAQSHGDARRTARVAIHNRRRIESAHDHIERAVAVEIGQCDALRDGTVDVKAPRFADVVKGEIAAVAQRDTRRGESRELLRFPIPGHAREAVANAFVRIGFPHVVPVAVHREQVFIAIEIHIEKRRAPRPVGGGNTGEVADLRPRAVAARELQHVAHPLRAFR